MIIKNSEALKSWLIVVLEPLCDADSSALARYVLALLKKDKPEKELKKLMIEQLDVFLGEETKPFVERLFVAINTEEYFTTILLPVTKLEVDPVIATECISSIVDMKDNTRDAESVTEPSMSPQDLLPITPVEKINTPPADDKKAMDQLSSANSLNNKPDITARFSHYGGTDKSDSTALTGHSYPVTNIHHEDNVSLPFRANADKENQPRESRRRRASIHSQSRSRSRSRSNERPSRRSRSRDRRINEREINQRQFRNKSPPTTDLRHVGTHERRRGGGSIGTDRKRPGNGSNITNSDDRSPRFGGNSVDGICRKNRQNRSNSLSPSSLERHNRNKVSPSSRCFRSSPERYNHHAHIQHEREKRQRCRDFDEKGYCVRGETCPWDHGINPVVFEDINNSALIGMSLPEYNPDAPDLWMRSTPGAMVSVSPSPLMSTAAALAGGVASGCINPFTGIARGSGILPLSANSTSVSFPEVSSADDKQSNNGGISAADYTQNTATGPTFREATPILPFAFNASSVTAPLQRELIPIPVVDGGKQGSGNDITQMQADKRRFDSQDSVAIAEVPAKRKLPLNSRLGIRLPGIQNNCSLEIRKVPRGLNSIAHLNNHFAKFGKIVNIQISYDGDPEAAIVTFSTHAEANVAYRSTEAVLNNRFIKVFWHSQEAAINENALVAIGGPRKNNQYHLNNIPAVPIPSADSAKISNDISNHSTASTGNASDASTINELSNTKTSIPPLAAAHVPPTSLRQKNNVPRVHNAAASNAMLRKKQEEQAKAVVQLANGLRKRKQELLQSYVKQMKSALELVQRCDQNDPQRTKTLETIKVLQATIDKLRKEIAAEQEQIQAQMQNQHPTLPKTKEQQKKELLDIELELFAQQQEGNDTTAIQKRLEELQRNLGIVSGSGSACAISALPQIGGKISHFPSIRTNNRTRTSFPEGSTRVDRRPKTIVVTGFSREEADFVLGHFKHFGEITKHDMDKEIPQLILSYATRISAEQAILRAKVFKDRRLQITWAPVVSTLSTSEFLVTDKFSKTEVTSDATKIIASGNYSDKLCNDSEISGETLPELKLEDEEEDEESEDRSWRR